MGEMIQTKIVCSGDIFIIPNNTLRLNDIIGNEKILPCNVWNDKTVPILRTRIEPIKIEEREKLLDALTEIADTDPLLRYYVDTITHEIIISFLGTVQLEVICSLLIEKYHINIRIEDPTVIYLEKPLQKADYTIHIEVPPNPFWASIGLSITPLPIGTGIQYESKVSLGYLNQSFQNAVREGINYGLEQGLYGWKVTDCKICFEYGVYYSPVSTPSDFRFLAPIVLEQTLKKAGTQLLEPYLSFILFTPEGYFSRAYKDAQKHCAIIETSQSKNDEVIFSKDDSLLESDNKANRDLLTVKGILEFANIVDIEDVDFIITRQIEMNTAISEEGIKNEYGSSIGRTLLKYYGDSIHNKAKAMAAAGSDARMGGCSMPVVTNSGSGNQGITVSIPVIEYAKSMNIGKEKLYRALVISNLTSILQKRYIGKLSAFCGVVSASAGSAAGIAYLHDKDFDTIAKTIINTLCTIGGVVCDGAKESCASKIAEALDCAILGFNMASDNKVFKAGYGLASDNVEDTIANIGRMAKDGMKSTDVEILKIMIGK